MNDRDMHELPEETLSAYLDGECTAAERAAVDARLAGDPEWRAILDELRVARELVRALPEREAPPGFLESLLVLDDARPSRWPRAVALVTAAAAVVVGFALATPSRPGGTVQPQLATLSDSHGATASLGSDPISSLAPVAVPVTVGR
jgi:anti-sigma factor RsiW